MWKNKEKAIAQAVGKAIAKKRMEKGLTQENVAEKLNIGYEAVSRIERGIVTPNIARLVELAEIFDCEIDELLMNIVTALAERLRKDGGKN
ncbi:helix-turn-helix domain-containing protein [Oxalobacter aliiformigenes]|uniref:helix-turn-helix domain-containing protein n=1 Tax=Oxalobacter aliiformigenes TaxID=2946593 RepID=UPI0022AF8BC8|nr:helix-turn-helix transcriptional regulator [Oxalobacter aliiformigenes]MCZ4063954.1 helix-turn-helix domain-containing protein [Oxalobacter aliiformigenes]WAV98575.1 helix-turn-helix domain-containing protein [Oxalobacter aliiformigenes]